LRFAAQGGKIGGVLRRPALKIYTKTGDHGETGLLAGPRVGKEHPRIEAYGTVDELAAAVGVARAEGPPDEVDSVLGRIQHELFMVGAELASPTPGKRVMSTVGEQHIGQLERDIDRLEEQLPPLTEFILPGGSKASAALHVARTQCRRSERRVVALTRQPDGTVSRDIIIYLNRLGDLLFVLARIANQTAKIADEVWRKEGPV
jgi:cob(I)alamin adenosyltransferase